MNVTKRMKKWMNNYADIIDFDTDNNIATVHLHYDTVDDLLEENLQSTCISLDVIKELQSILLRIPYDFKVDYVITVSDYKGCDKEMLHQAFDRTVEMIKFSRDKRHHRISKIMIRNIFWGLAVAIVMILCQKFSVFSSSGPIFSVIILQLINIGFELYFEEGVTFFAVDNPKEKIHYRRFKRFNSVVFE